MPDVKQVYEMVTKQRPPDVGALERQRTRQIRTMRNRRVGAFAVAAAIGAAAVVVEKLHQLVLLRHRLELDHGEVAA